MRYALMSLAIVWPSCGVLFYSLARAAGRVSSQEQERTLRD